MSDPSDEYAAELDGFGPSVDADRGRHEVERIASEFAARLRAGRRAEPASLADVQADLEAEVRDVLPVVAALEQWKVSREVECVRGSLPAVFPVRRLGDCRLVREIGRGGNGIVFEAIQGVTWFRRVAVKLFPWRYAADASPLRKRFRREAATLARLRHRNVVEIESFGEDGGYCYYVMELVDGPNLAEAIRRLRLDRDEKADGRAGYPSPLRAGDWKAFAEIGLQAAYGLQHAHERGVLHNDVKPANLLLATDPWPATGGRIVVTDFGPSPRLQPGPPQRGPQAGTRRYMAPERFAGTSDARSDVYSLGATLYELTTLAPAFDAESPEELDWQISRQPVVPPRRRIAGLSVDLEAVILKAMSRDPAQRYPTAAALAADLLRFLHGRRVEARRGLIGRCWARMTQAGWRTPEPTGDGA